MTQTFLTIEKICMKKKFLEQFNVKMRAEIVVDRENYTVIIIRDFMNGGK